MSEEKEFLEDGLHEEETQNEQAQESQEVNPLQAQLNEVNDKYLRLAAEFDNYRKRSAKEKLDTIKNASESMMVSLLDVLDDTIRAEEQLKKNDDIEASKEGILLVFNKLHSVLKSKGLEEMKTIGEDFDPELHEALTEIPAPTPDLAGKVVDEITKGYTLNDKIIRHAKVIVGR